jgi:glycosyltransferase involved in cell wall biosynthesis
MTILFIAPRFHTNQFIITKSLVDRGHNVVFFVQRKNKLEDYKYIEPILVKKSLFGYIFSFLTSTFLSPNKAESLQVFFFFPSFFFLLRKILQIKPNIVIYRDRNLVTLFSYIISKALGIKINILYNQSPLADTNHKYKFLKNFLFPNVLYSPVIYSKINKFDSISKELTFDNHKYFVPFIFKKQNFSIIENSNNLSIRILSVGKYRSYKNHFLLVEAFSKLKFIDRYTLIIIGQCNNEEECKYYNSLKDYVSSKQLTNRIILMKNVEYNEMDYYYRNSDVFVLSSLKELASVSLIEAMSYGLIPISTNYNGTSTYINRQFGFIFETNITEELLCVLNNLVNINIINYRKNNQEFFNKNYTPNIFIESINFLLSKEFNIKL